MSIHRHYTPFIDLDNQNNDQSDDDTNDLDNSQNNFSNQNNDYSDNSDNSQTDNSDNSIDDSFNDESDHSIDDSFNDESDHSIDDSFNDESDHSIDDSFNTDNSIDDSYNTDNSIDDAYNTDDSYNIDDAYNTDDSYNTDNSVADAYNDSSSHFGEIDVNFENVFNGAFGGVGGNASGFAFNQVADIVDNDNLSGVTQNNYGTFNAQAYADEASFESSDGGHGGWGGPPNMSMMGGGHGGDPMVSAGHNANLVADASAHVSASAFNQDIVLGANLQQNAADVTVVGGNMDNDITDTSGDHF